jgi:hypothetical protein
VLTSPTVVTASDGLPSIPFDVEPPAPPRPPLDEASTAVFFLSRHPKPKQDASGNSTNRIFDAAQVRIVRECCLDPMSLASRESDGRADPRP